MNEDAQQNDVRNDSEADGTVPNHAEQFGTVRNSAEVFRKVPNAAERNESHTLTVREVARMFEAAGVARTERSIVNWCQRDAQGMGRLDARLDQNEHRYFITPQSVERAIAEEKAKAAKGNSVSEQAGNLPKISEDSSKNQTGASDRVSMLEKEVLDLKILHSGKDFLIQQLRQERDGFFKQVVDASRKVGELEARLLQLSGPDGEGSENGS
jgi:hypothetical protein